MIKREVEQKLIKATMSYPVIALTGPRQSGKTTLIRELFKKEYQYVNLENLEMRAYAKNDPKAFLEEYGEKLIIDEAQHVPELFSYIQVIVDEKKINGQFILIGSQNFLLLEKITQSLAGRVAIFHLLPFSLNELKNTKYQITKLEKQLLQGFYPRLYDQNLEPGDWLANYIHTYIERDVRSIKNITNLNSFQNFLKMCAARTGQLLDYTSIGNDCGISHNTVKEWLNILEASFIVFLLRPHFKNFNKRLVKSPKIYFYDTGLLCYLLGIETEKQLSTHYLRGGIFESFILSELVKNQFNKNLDPNIYFWRDKKGREIDCIMEKGESLTPLEIKSAKTINPGFFDGIKYWNSLSGNLPENSYLVYAGSESQKRSIAKVISWQNISEINS
jgi:uncharacterized protein